MTPEINPTEQRKLIPVGQPYLIVHDGVLSGDDKAEYMLFEAEKRDPQFWALIVADTIRHIAQCYDTDTKTVHALVLAELDEPTSDMQRADCQ